MIKKEAFFTPALLGAILFLAGLLRLNGIDFGLPYLYNPDEPSVVNPAIKILTRGDWNPHWFDWPGCFVMYALALFYALALPGFFLFCRSAGITAGLDPFVQWMKQDPTFIYLSGRLFMCFLAVLSIYVLYRLSEKLFGKRIAFLSVWVLTIAPLHVAHSQCIRPDTTGILLVLLSLCFLFAHIENGSQRAFCAAALFAGFSASAKYTLALIFLPVAIHAAVEDCKSRRTLAAYLRDSLQIKTRLSKAFFFAGIGFFISAPFVILDFRASFQGILFNLRPSHLGADRLPGMLNFLWYLTVPLQKGIGGIFFQIFAGLGILRLIRSRSYKSLLLLAFPFALLLLIGNANLRFDRWALPLLPFESLCFALGFSAALDWCLRRSAAKIVRVFCILSFLSLLAGFSVPALAVNRWHGNYLRRPDTRTIAKQWIESHLPAGSKIAYEQYTPQLHILPSRHFELMDLDFDQIISKSIEAYREAGVNYAVISDAFKSRYYAEPQKYPDQIARYERLKKEAVQIKSFSGKGFQGPRIEIYGIGTAETKQE